MTLKPHLSATQLDMYARCPEQYRRRYIEGEIIPPGIALIVGGSLHKGAEVNFRQKIETHQDLPAEDIIEIAAEEFSTRTAGEYALTDDEHARGIGVVIGEAKDMTASLARVHALQQAPDYQPVSVEHTTRIVLPKASRDLLAITDLRDDQGRVTDLKTASRRLAPSAVDTSLQLTIYAAAFQVDNGQPPSEVRLDVLTKTKTPARQLLRGRRDERDLQALANRINETLRAIEAGIFPPCPTDAWVCAPKWCGYWATCPYVNSERRAAAESNGE
jgi:hypothetical protein